MSSGAECGAGGRARPASGALWTLFSWLRREERAPSSDSLSSAGSDRSAASFAFLAPHAPRPPHAAAHAPAPPTDSYRKRVHDGNLRRQRERNLTLHRKYGLYYGYDAFSLPHRHLDVDEWDRERRANSESFPRRAAHVPGKRRAPPPPAEPGARPLSLISTTSLTRRHNRKRPAPLPPVKSSEKLKENIQSSGFENINITSIFEMNSNSNLDRHPTSNVTSNDCRSEKYSKKGSDSKEIKVQKEKSFLKQIFEKKRNSTIDSAPERILPSISELDKQAAKIIESCKLKPIEHTGDSSNGLTNHAEMWFCTRCLRRYDSTTVTCQNCLPEQKRLSNFLVNDNCSKTAFSSVVKSNDFAQTEKEDITTTTTRNRISGIGADEKQKLKEMLKEMKDSLPKKPKQNNDDKVHSANIYIFDSDKISSSLETPTLRVESKALKERTKTMLSPQPSTSTATSNNITEIRHIEKILPQIKPEPVTENVVITQHVVLVAPDVKKDEKQDSENKISSVVSSTSSASDIFKEGSNKVNEDIGTKSTKTVNNLHIPLKISSLLNPVYIPKDDVIEEQSPRSRFFLQNNVKYSVSSTSANSALPSASCPSSNASTSATSDSKLVFSQTAMKPIDASTSPVVETKLTGENKQRLSNSDQQPSKKSETKDNTALNQTLPTLHPANTSFLTASTGANVSWANTKLINSNMTKFAADQHSRRRDLVNQLEQSIAKGDERAAADAAVKLAQLRLACSVLSYSSQIMATPPPAELRSLFDANKPEVRKLEPTQTSNKVNTAVQSTAIILQNTEMKNNYLIKDISEKKNIKVQSKATSTNNTQLQNKNHNKNETETKHKLPSDAPSTSKQAPVSNETDSNLATIQIWVEDREATRGPVRLRIPRQATMGDLRRQAEISLGLVGALQRWIVGRALCTDDRTPLVSLAGADLSAPFYLCVVETDKGGTVRSEMASSQQTNNTAHHRNDKASDVYSELVQLEQRALVANTDPFECSICIEDCAAGGGAVLRECVHMFCKDCLSDLVKHCEEPVVSCPAMGCLGILQEREIRGLVTQEEYERWLARGLAAAESGTRNAFHCRTRDCAGWALCDPGVRRFPCPVCKHNNCISCQAIHEGETCEQHRKKKIQEAVSNPISSETDDGTKALLETLITKGEALECPECSAIITKKWGCDWVKCSACKTEICWVTRGRRWGPGGKGDTSGGCQCGVDGKRCHPSCGYCH